MAKQELPATPRAIKSQQTRENIYQAAMQLLNEYGYEYITVSNICKLAKVSTGSFYHYFESKDVLMANFFFEAYNKFEEKYQTELEDPLENIIQFFCCYADFCQEKGLDFIRNFYTPFNRSMSLKGSRTGNGEFVLPGMQSSMEKLRRETEKGVFRADCDLDQIAEDLCTITKGCIYEWCVSDGSFVIRELVERLLLNYLKAYLA